MLSHGEAQWWDCNLPSPLGAAQCVCRDMRSPVITTHLFHYRSQIALRKRAADPPVLPITSALPLGEGFDSCMVMHKGTDERTVCRITRGGTKVSVCICVSARLSAPAAARSGAAGLVVKFESACE